MTKSFNVQLLRAKIRGLQAEGVSLQKAIKRASGARRDELWTRKRQLGDVCRYHLIAYGLLRGVDYRNIENLCKNKPSISRVFSTLTEHQPYMTEVLPTGGSKTRKWSLEDVQRLLGEGAYAS